MPMLDPRLRCDNCGYPMESVHERCPSCHADLSEVGVFSEIDEWSKERRQGKARFVLRHCLVHSIVALVASCVTAWVGGKPLFLLLVPIGLLSGGIQGLWSWRLCEAEYLAARDHQADRRR